jgi:hypothetical protein
LTFFDFFDQVPSARAEQYLHQCLRSLRSCHLVWQSKNGDLTLGALLLTPTYRNYSHRFDALYQVLGIERQEPQDVKDKDGTQKLQSRLIPLDDVLRKIFRSVDAPVRPA